MLNISKQYCWIENCFVVISVSRKTNFDVEFFFLRLVFLRVVVAPAGHFENSFFLNFRKTVRAKKLMFIYLKSTKIAQYFVYKENLFWLIGFASLTLSQQSHPFLEKPLEQKN